MRAFIRCHPQSACHVPPLGGLRIKHLRVIDSISARQAVQKSTRLPAGIEYLPAGCVLTAGRRWSSAAVLGAGPVLHSSAPSLRGLEQLEHWSRTETFKADWLLQSAPVVLQFIEL
jgi:hypothetical protein